MRVFFVFLIFSFGSYVETHAGEPRELKTLRNVMIERLAIMPDVARYKWNNKIPVEDKPREQRLLARTVTLAVEAGLEPAFAERAIAAQMEASKLYQSELISVWQREGKGAFSDVPDLVRDIRPKITAITPLLMDALRAAGPLLGNCMGISYLTNHEGTGVSAAIWHTATDGLVPAGCR